jgi:F-type H+-transporting ATPase subunit b
VGLPAHAEHDEARRRRSPQSIGPAQVAETRADAEKQAARILADAQAEASQVVQEATERASKAAQDVKAAAEAEAAKAHTAALADAEQERNRMLSDLRGQVAALAIAAAHKLVGETLDERRQHALLDEFFSGTQAGKLVVLESANLRGESAEVTSALPLTEYEQDCVKRDVLAKVGAPAVAFRVDPSILGGLIIQSGTKWWTPQSPASSKT